MASDPSIVARPFDPRGPYALTVDAFTLNT